MAVRLFVLKKRERQQRKDKAVSLIFLTGAILRKHCPIFGFENQTWKRHWWVCLQCRKDSYCPRGQPPERWTAKVFKTLSRGNKWQSLPCLEISIHCEKIYLYIMMSIAGPSLLRHRSPHISFIFQLGIQWQKHLLSSDIDAELSTILAARAGDHG